MARKRADRNRKVASVVLRALEDLVDFILGHPSQKLAVYGPLRPGQPNYEMLMDVDGSWKPVRLNGVLDETGLPRDVPMVDFVMLNRLAELIIRSSAALQLALRETYPFVFVDEFQDTTFSQYTFLRSVFGRDTVVTAVGDRKQRIMGWAGALEDAFVEFTTDFDAAPYELLCNFRSTQALVACSIASPNN
jgi:hypothetical protein